MNNFDAMKQYFIPSNLLTTMLEVYKKIGQNPAFNEKLTNSKLYLQEQTIERDTYFMANLIHLHISDNRMRLIITKNSAPTTLEERNLVGLKEVIRNIQFDAKDHTFNGSDILQYLNKIFGKNSHKFTNKSYRDIIGSRTKNTKPMSIRLSFEKMLEEYHQNVTKKTYEPLYLSIIAYLEMEILQPYSDHNSIASILALYYMLLRSDLEVFRYISFIEKYIQVFEQWEQEKKMSYINYQNSHLQLNGIIQLLFDIILESYSNLQDMIRENSFEKRMFKGDGIEQTIYQLPNTFTKEDIRRFHPQVSESTINRALFKLRDENIITPLGKGRSARWVKLISDDDPRNIFGQNYEISSKE